MTVFSSTIRWAGPTRSPPSVGSRHTTSLKYRLTVGQARVAGIWQFGGYGQNNASNGAYQVGVGGDIPNLANGVLSVDAIYSYVKGSVAVAAAGDPPTSTGRRSRRSCRKCSRRRCPTTEP